jgi:hypothetical protein
MSRKKQTKKQLREEARMKRDFQKIKRNVSTCKIGNRAAVWNGSAEKTSGGLRKADLMLNKDGKIVSKKQSRAAAIRFKK